MTLRRTLNGLDCTCARLDVPLKVVGHRFDLRVAVSGFPLTLNSRLVGHPLVKGGHGGTLQLLPASVFVGSETAPLFEGCSRSQFLVVGVAAAFLIPYSAEVLLFLILSLALRQRHCFLPLGVVMVQLLHVHASLLFSKV